MKVMPEHARPGFAEPLERIGEAGQPLGGHARALCGIGEQLVLAIEPLHRRLGRMRADAVRLHRQLALVHRKRGLLLRGQIVGELIDGRIADFDATVLIGQRLLQPLDGLGLRRAADVPHAEQPVHHGASIAERCGIVRTTSGRRKYRIRSA